MRDIFLWKKLFVAFSSATSCNINPKVSCLHHQRLSTSTGLECLIWRGSFWGIYQAASHVMSPASVCGTLRSMAGQQLEKQVGPLSSQSSVGVSPVLASGRCGCSTQCQASSTSSNLVLSQFHGFLINSLSIQAQTSSQPQHLVPSSKESRYHHKHWPSRLFVSSSVYPRLTPLTCRTPHWTSP